MDNHKEAVCLISLGCAKNLVDSEHILGLLRDKGFPIVTEVKAARMAILNTCGFIRTAVEESIEHILELGAMKAQGHLKKVLVVGCLVQRYGYKLRREIPEVDGWLGTGELMRIPELLGEGGCAGAPFFLSRPGAMADLTSPRVQTTPYYSAYLKIAEGCSHRCAYCIIPRLRGPYRSRRPESLVREARGMAERGVREINLIAQDTSMYGRDLGEGVRIEDLLEQLLEIGGIDWIRVLYGHPQRVSDRLLDLLGAGGPLCCYLDIPLQHVNRGILKAMGRDSAKEDPWELMARIRRRTPGITLRTTLMVGFPGETEEAFRELYEFVAQAGIDRLGTFTYSREEGTAAARLPGQVPCEVTRERRAAIMDLQGEISGNKNQGMVGQVLPVLLEGRSPETDLLLTGRTEGMAPDVDGRVLINKGWGRVGQIVPVRITEAHAHDLVGEIL